MFREPRRFQLNIEPNIIIRWTGMKDFDLERRIRKIERYLDGNRLWLRIWKLPDGSHQYWARYKYGDLEKYQYDPFKNRTFVEILDEYLPDVRPDENWEALG